MASQGILMLCCAAQQCLTLCDPMDTAKFLCPWRFSRQEYWSGFPGPPPGDFPNPGTELASLTSPAFAGRFFTTSATWEAHLLLIIHYLFPKNNY